MDLQSVRVLLNQKCHSRELEMGIPQKAFASKLGKQRLNQHNIERLFPGLNLRQSVRSPLSRAGIANHRWLASWTQNPTMR